MHSKLISTVVASLALGGSLAGCLDDPMVDVFSQEEFDIIKQFGPLGQVPTDPTNRYADDANAAAFGQRLFFEKSYSHALTIAEQPLAERCGVGVVGEAVGR